MKSKGNGCYSITKSELIDVMRAGGILWTGKFGPSLHDPRVTGWRESKELHPRHDTVRKLIRDGTLVYSDDANEVQQSCGMDTLRLAAAAQGELAR